MFEKESAKREMWLGALGGLIVGGLAVALVLFLVRPWERAEAPPTPQAEVAESDTPGATSVVPDAGGVLPGPSPTVTVTALTLPTPTATPTPTPLASGVTTHTVQQDETLSHVAYNYDVSVKDLMAANDIDDPDSVWAGTVLIIPGGTAPAASAATTTTVTETTTAITTTPSLTAEPEPWIPSILEGDLASAYSGVSTTERFSVHYTPGTYPEETLDEVTSMLERALAHLEATFETQLEGTFDVYVAGSLFAPPDQALRGRSFSAAWRYFFLHDSTGNATDQQYIAAHEMTHLFTWNAFGRPVSAMLSEGAAVYAGMTLIGDSDHMPIEQFCRAYYAADQLPRVSGSLRFEGHIRDLPNYYTAGCFVQYLVETYGAEKFGQLYPTGSYSTVYNKSLTALESEWLAAIEQEREPLPFEPPELLDAVDAVGTAYSDLFAGFSGTPAQMEAYRAVDAARIALLEGRFEDVAIHLNLEQASQDLD